MTNLVEARDVAVGSPTYNRVVEFLYSEARLLDESRLTEWLELTTEETTYRVPVRQNVKRADGHGFATTAFYLDENRFSLGQRAARIGNPADWSEDPPARAHRLVTNILVTAEHPGELHVRSSILMIRNRWDSSAPELISASREDTLHDTETGLKIHHREVLLDRTNLASITLLIL